MGTITSGGGLLADVQRRLALGQSDAQILAELTASGLSRPSAERFLQRARAGDAPAPGMPALPPPIPLVAPLPSADATALDPPPLVAAPTALAASAAAESAPAHTFAWVSVLGAAATLTLGLAGVTWGLSQERNVRIRLPLVIAFTGGAWLLQASRRVVDPRRPVTWLLPAAAAMPPLLAFVVVLGTLAAGRPRPPGQAAGVNPSAQPAVSTTPAGTTARRATRPSTPDERLARSVATLVGTRPGNRCSAAQALAQLGASEHASIVERHLSDATALPQKICFAHALTQLGGGDVTASHYLEWSAADDDLLRHHAIVGFGHLGPGAAPETLPVLEQIVEGGASPARRYVVVKTLARLGPGARPLLQTLAGDDDAEVRAAAQAALRSMP